jgi:hypothetical protein
MKSRNPNHTISQILVRIRLLRPHLRPVLRRINEIPKWIKDTTILLCTARVIPYSAVLLYWAFPSWSLQKVDLFLSPSYHNSMVLTWWIKYLCNDIELLLIAYAFCKVCAQVSNYLFLVSVIFLGYHLLDVLMFLWNFKRYDLFYFDIMWTVIALVYSVFKGYRTETVAKIKSLF